MKKFLFLLALVLHGTCSAQWTQILPTSSVGTFTYYDMSVLAGANGNDTIFVAGTAGAGKPRLYRSYDGGTTWTSLPFFNYNPHSLSELQSVVAWRSGVVLVSGSNINGSWTYRSTDFGQTWNDAETQYGIMAGSKWGPDDSYAGAVTAALQWGFTKDEGLTYSIFSHNIGQAYGRSQFLSDSLFFALKSDGCIYKTTNQAQSWQGLRCGLGALGFVPGWFFSQDTGLWCADTRLIRTYDGGNTWDTIPVPSYRIHFADRNKGIVWGGTQASFSDDGGNTWSLDTTTIAIGGKERVWRTQNTAYVLGSSALLKKTLLTSNNLQLSKNIQIYPNPSEKSIYFQGFNGNEIIEIYDLQGKKILEQKVMPEVQHNLESGTFKLVIKDKNNQIKSSKTIIIQ